MESWEGSGAKFQDGGKTSNNKTQNDLQKKCIEHIFVVFKLYQVINRKNMAGAGRDLFKWNRQTKPSPNVQRASDNAAREMFGNDFHRVLDQVHVDEDALMEAQDLLDKWTHEKQVQNIAPDLEFYDEAWIKTTHTACSNSSRSRGEGSSMFFLTEDGRVEVGGLYDDSFKAVEDEKPPRPGAEYEEGLEEEISVQQVLRDMLDKQVVENDIMSDLGFNDSHKRKDPRPKMELRHQQVKAKSENRRRQEEKVKREKNARKEAEHLARQQILKEERERQARIKQEEQLVQQEMMRIRRAMEEEKRQKKEQAQREQMKLAEAEQMARQYMEEEERRKEQKRQQEQEAKEEMRRLLLKQMEEQAATVARQNLQLLRRHFSAWYTVVVEQRIKFGKASALADWRCKLRAWNAWRAYVWHIKSDKEAQAIAVQMKERHRKEQIALNFHRKHLLQRCIVAWQLFVRESQHNRKLQEEHQRKTNKMAALLEAAASGRLWNKNSQETGDNEISVQDVELVDSRPSTARKVDEIFSQDPRRPPTDRSSVDATGSTSRRAEVAFLPNKPHMKAWGNNSGNARPKTTAKKDTSRTNHSALGLVRDRPASARKYVNKQRTSSANAAKVSDLRARLKESSKISKGFHRSRSTDMINSRNSEMGPDRVMEFEDVSQSDDDQSDLLVDLDTERSATSTKLLSREAKVKSNKPTTTPLMLAMEARAKEREARKALIEKRKRKLEEEKLAKLKEEQARKEAEVEKEKQEILKKKREERRLARERELEKQRRLEEIRQLNVKAEQHYCRTLLMKYGLSPWRQLVAMAHQNLSSAIEHHAQALVITCFYPWLQFARENSRRQQEAADQLFRRILLRRSWRSWRKYGQHMVRLEVVAEDYCSAARLRKYFRLWQCWVTDEQILYWEKERRAHEHDLVRLQKLAFTYWKKLIPMAQEERKREARKLEMRNRVKAWLPDFQGTGQHSSP
ncbi:coiled-coil domain-containing protein 191 isoform X2 [Nematostella vectensis]|uniref:coiled-coil domain-containing protein 191 isoform X2 n=1 Tax=Nematostella vectensis TaxID=45351 RepID=UPI00207774E2|nr:coiled-coil domain-containing protein 191 isoform X2 [Nematostella vectensis]